MDDPENTNNGTVKRDDIVVKTMNTAPQSSFPWWIIPLLLIPILAIGYFLTLPKSNSNSNYNTTTTPAPTIISTQSVVVTLTPELTISPIATIVPTATP